MLQNSDTGKCFIGTDCGQALNSQRVDQQSPGPVVDTKKGAEFVSCPFQHVSVILEVRTSESASRPPEADVGVIIYPAVACPSSCWLG